MAKILSLLRNKETPWRDRYFLKEYMGVAVDIHVGTGCGSTLTFGDFKVIPWGGAINCGFNVWEAIPGGKKKKLWIDIDPYLNVATSVKDESGFLRGINYDEKNKILETMDKMHPLNEGGITDKANDKDIINKYFTYGQPSTTQNHTQIGPNYEMRTPERIPDFFKILFPNGYYKSEDDSAELIGGPPQSTGGRRKKRKKTKRKNRSKNITKSKR